MTLTEQWKKGELEEGYYYVKSDWSDGVDIRYVHNGVDDWREITAPVPSYEEWQELSKQRNQLIRDVKDLAYIQEENQQLKELLITCKYCTLTLISKGVSDCNGMRLSGLITKIDNAIGEKK